MSLAQLTPAPASVRHLILVGASQGLALVKRPLREGHRMAATSRNPKTLAAAAAFLPLHLLLGPDAYQRASTKLDGRRQNFEAWQPFTLSTSFEA